MVKIIKQIVPESVISKSTYGYGNPVKSITIHQTGNSNKGADAQAHANLQSRGNSRNASWHYTVDDIHAIQSFPDNVKCWHATDGRGPGNTTSLAIEICINSDGDYKKAIDNAAKLTKHLLEKHNLSIEDVKQHRDWYNKNCPAQLRSGYKGITWSDFLSMVEGKEVTVKPQVKPPSTTKIQNKANLTVDGKWGTSTTKELQKALGTISDGVISNQPRNHVTEALYGGVTFGHGSSMVIVALQRKVGATVDGKLGPNTIRSVQKYLGTPIDGKISRPSSLVVKEMQRRLNNGTF